MNRTEILRQVADGTLDVAEAEQQLAALATEADLGFARVDLDRPRRCGLAEVIFAEGKTPDQMVGLVGALLEAGQSVFATRVRPEHHQAVAAEFPDIVYHEAARVLTMPSDEAAQGIGRICVVCAGTSDIPVAEEAALVLEHLGHPVDRIHDVGVAGIHRLFSVLDRLRAARALVVAAGMEGALPSVVAGLVDRPVVAVPTSIGYGASFGGVAALLGMLNSCAPGIGVVNIDNGFGAATLVHRIAPEASGENAP